MGLAQVQRREIQDRRLFGDRTAVRQYRAGVHLQMDVVREPKGLEQPEFGWNVAPIASARLRVRGWHETITGFPWERR